MSRQTPLTCPGHTRPVVQLHYSDVTPTGYYLISASKDGKPMLRQGETGDWIGTFEGHKGAVWGACLSKDATKAATGAADFSAKLWNSESGSEKFSFTHKHIVKAVDFCEDGSKLLTGCNDKKLRVFDLSPCSGTPVVELDGHRSAIKCAVWNKCDNSLLSCADDNELRLWDTRVSSCVNTFLLESPATSLELTNNGEVLTVANGNCVTFINPSTLTLVKSYSMPTQTYSATLSVENESFVTGGEDFKIYKFAYQDGRELESYKGHFGPVHCVRYSPDGEVYCSGSEDGTVRLWLNTVGKKYGLWKSSGENSSEALT